MLSPALSRCLFEIIKAESQFAESIDDKQKFEILYSPRFTFWLWRITWEHDEKVVWLFISRGLGQVVTLCLHLNELNTEPTQHSSFDHTTAVFKGLPYVGQMSPFTPCQLLHTTCWLKLAFPGPKASTTVSSKGCHGFRVRCCGQTRCGVLARKDGGEDREQEGSRNCSCLLIFPMDREVHDTGGQPDH